MQEIYSQDMETPLEDNKKFSKKTEKDFVAWFGTTVLYRGNSNENKEKEMDTKILSFLAQKQEGRINEDEFYFLSDDVL